MARHSVLAWWIVGLVLLFTERIDSVPFSMGTGTPGIHNSILGTETNRAFFMEGYPSTGCGMLNNFEYGAMAAGTVTGQIWRATGTVNMYELVYKESFAVVVGTSSHNVAPQIEIEPGDVVGWVVPTSTEIIGHSTTAGAPVQDMPYGSITVGDVLTWGFTPDTTKTYAFGAIVNDNEVPVNNDVASPNHPDTIAIDTPVVTSLDITDADEATTDLTVTMTANPPSTDYFKVVNTGTAWEIQTATADTPAGTYALEIVAEDRCGATDTSTVTVTITSTKPAFVAAPATSDPLPDDTVGALRIARFSVSDPDKDPITCTPSDSKFEVIRLVDPPVNPQEFDIRTKSTVTEDDIDFNDNPPDGDFTMAITCTDGTTSISHNIIVDVTDTPPTLTLDPATTTLSPGVQGTTKIADVTCTDSDDTVTTSVDNTKFEIVADELQTVSGQTLLTSDSPITLTVTCDDGVTQVTETIVVTVGNLSPVLSGLPATSIPLEDNTQVLNSPAGFYLGSFTCSDIDSLTVSIDPPVDPYEIRPVTPTDPVNKEYAVYVRGDATEDQIDFDDGARVLTISCSDSTNPAVTDSFTVDIQDRPPTLTVTQTTTEVGDGVPGAVDIATINCDDSDDNDDARMTVTVDNAKFEVVGSSPDYTLRTKASSAFTSAEDPIALTVTCNDGNNDVTDTLSVGVGNAAPVLTGPATSNPITDDTLGDFLLGTFTCTDLDTVLTFTVLPTTGPYEARPVVPATVPATFDVYTKSATVEDDIDFDDGAVTVTVRCDDGNNAPVDVSFAIDITDQVPALTVTQTVPSVGDGTQAALDIADVTCADGDDSGRMTVTVDDTTNFEITGVTAYKVSVKAGVTLLSSASPLTPKVTCNDGNNIVEDTTTISLVITNAKPVLTGPATSDPLLDSTTGANTPAGVFLGKFTCDDIDPVTLVLNPLVAGYEVRPVAATYPADFDIYTSSSATEDQIDANDLPQDLNVECSDGINPAESLTFSIDIQDTPHVLTDPTTPFVGLSDDSSDERVGDFTITDGDDDITCVIDPAQVEERKAFEIRKVGGTPQKFEVYLKASPIIKSQQEVPSYDLNIHCDDVDNANPTVIVNQVVNMTNAPPKFKDLPWPTIDLEENHHEAVSTLLFTVTATDTTKLDCYLSEPKNAPGIIGVLDQSAAPPDTVLRIYVQGDPWYNVEPGPNLIPVGVTCHDLETVIRKTLTVRVNNSPPEVTNPGGSVTIPEFRNASNTYKHIKLKRFDKEVQCTLNNDYGGLFEIIDNTYRYTATPPIPSDPPSYLLEATCEDADGASTTDTFTINVENQGPKITLKYPGGLVHENETAFTRVGLIETNEPIDSCVCTQVTGTLAFECHMDPLTNEWGVYYKGGELLDWDVQPFYKIKVKCTDTSTPGKEGPEREMHVHVKKNEPPVYNVPDIWKITKVEHNAKATMAGDILYQVDATDPEGDAIEYEILSCVCEWMHTTCDDIYYIETDGTVRSNVDLATVVGPHLLNIRAKDKYNPDAEPMRLYITLKGNNIVPEWTQPPDTVGVLEDKLVGHEVYKFINKYDYTEYDADDTITVSCDFYGSGGDYFECVDGAIRVKAALDYETQLPSYTVDVTLNDGYNDSVTRPFTIRVLNVNEPPEWNANPTSLTYNEGKGGDLVGCPNFDVTDPDGNKVELTMSCPTGKGIFHLDQEDNCIYMTAEWDLDDRSKSPRPVLETIPCKVTATDPGHLFADVDFEINIEEINDNPPELNQDMYAVCVAVGSSGTDLLTATATDEDVQAKHRQQKWTLAGGGPFSVDENGVITAGDVSSYGDYGYFPLELMVSDGKYTDVARVDVTICKPPPPMPPVVVPPNTNNNAGTVVSSNDTLFWLIPALLLLALMGGLLAFLAYRCYRNGQCKCCHRSGAARRSRPGVIEKQQKPPRTPPRSPPRSPPRRRSPSPPPPPPPPPPGALPAIELPMTYNYARNAGHNVVTG